MKRSVLFTLLFFYSSVGACTVALAQGNGDEAAIRQALRQAYEAVNAGDAAAFFQVLDSSASSFAWYGAPLYEWQDPEGLRDAFAAGMAYDITPTDTEVRLFDDAAVVTEYFSGTHTSTDGEVSSLNVRATSVLVKQDGNWKVVHFHHSPLASVDGDQDQ